MKQILKQIILMNRKIGVPSDLLERDIKLSEYFNMHPKKILVLTGFRRVGKSYLCYQAMKNIGIDNSIYLNFEDERIPEDTKVLTSLSEVIEEIKPGYVFLDEIQNIPRWSKWVRRFYDREKSRMQIVITGSSSKLSNKEIPTELRGRTIIQELFPLSFHEFLMFKNASIDFNSLEYGSSEKSKLLKFLEEYVKYGGMPEIVNYPIHKKMKTIEDYLKLAVSRDIIERFRVRKSEHINTLIKLFLNSTHVTYSKLFNNLKSIGYSIGKESLIRYTSYIKNSYFIFELPQISRNIKNIIMSERKVYIIDNAFISFFSLKFSDNFGKLLENTVALELKRIEANNPLLELYYWKDYQHREVDFVLKQGEKIQQLIQVCYDIEDFNTKDRELKSLVKASKQLNCNNLLVITWDYESQEEFKGKTITFKPLWKWLLEI